MHSPSGYFVPEGMFCYLRRSLYGLKQPPRAWFKRFASVVTAADFFASAHDPALFVHVTPHGRTLLLYVDDMIITGDDPSILPLLRPVLVISFLCLILVILGTSLELRSPHMKGSFCLKISIFRIFLIGLLLLITGLLRLPWSSMFTIHPLMVSLLRILLVIIIL
jgi:hypothetical protein